MASDVSLDLVDEIRDVVAPVPWRSEPISASSVVPFSWLSSRVRITGETLKTYES